MLEELRALLGRDAVLAADQLVRWQVAGVTPHAVIFPDNTEQIAAVLRQASAARLPIEPAGAGTWLRAGRSPAAPPIVLSTLRLNRVIEYEPADLTAALGAGLSIGEFQQTAAQHRQCLALDAPAARGATIGALIATGSAGPQRYAYGAPRDQVLGLELVTGDGRVMKLGGRVVKNVAGYDLTRLVVGSRGTLGVVTQVNLRLRPLPAADVTFVFRGQAPELVALSAAVCNAEIEPAAVELIIPAHSDAALLCVRIQGNNVTLAAAGEELKRVAGRVPEVSAPETAAAIWLELDLAGCHADVSVRLAALPAEAQRLLNIARPMRSAFTRALIALHAGSGIVRVEGTGPVDVPALTRFLVEARSALAGVRGTVMLAAAPQELQARVALTGEPGGDLRLMQELKRAFDPAGIMAPGRFVV